MTETTLNRPSTAAAALELCLVDRPVWDDALDGMLVCAQVQPITHDVKTFVFQAVAPRFYRYEPGQYLTVALDIDGEQVNRCYTISSAPTRPYALAITVKRVPGGIVSGWLHDNMRPGRPVRVNGPLGTFSIARHPAQRYLFLSGGSGVTPLMSMTRTLHDLGVDTDVAFVHCARSPQDIVFREELAAIASASSGIRVTHVCETDAPGERWTGLRGRLTVDTLRLAVPDFIDREVFTCGPAPFMAAVREMLAGAGLDPSRHHEESFTFTEHQPAQVPAALPDEKHEASGFSVEFTTSNRTIQCRPDQFILDAALEAGLNLPSSCGEGLCGTCKSTMTSGQIDMNHQGGIRPREIAQNKILICCSKPLTDLQIEA